MNNVSPARRTPLYIGYAVPIMHYRAAGDVTVFRFFCWFDFFFVDGLSLIFVRNVGGCWKVGPGRGSC